MQIVRLLTAAIAAGSAMVVANNKMDGGLIAHANHLQARHHGLSAHRAAAGFDRVRRDRKCSKTPKHSSVSASVSSAPSAEPTSSSSSKSHKPAQSDHASLWGDHGSSSHASPSSASKNWGGSKSSSSAAAAPSSSNSNSGSGSSDNSSSSSSSSSGNNGSSSGSSGGSSSLNVQKNGLCWPNGPWVNIQPFKKTIGWLYSWDSTPATGDTSTVDFIPSPIKFYPMLWGNAGNRISNWQKYVLNDRNAKQNSAKVAMGPNEVNQGGQADLSVGDACSLMRKYILPLKNEDGWEIIGASTNGAPDGVTWMKNFKDQCSDVWNKIDADSTHFYGTDPQKAIEYFTQWHQTFGKPMFITETACMNYDGTASPSLGQQYDYVKKVNNWAHSTDWVKGIAFYGVMEQINIVQNARLATSSGEPTDLFNFWVNNS